MFRPVTRAKKTPTLPYGHLLVPVSAIGGMSTLLAVGLAVLGVLDRLNSGIAALVSRGGAETFPKHLPVAVIWLAAVLLAFGLAFAILNTPGLWKRAILWITAVVLVATWAPVLSLASHAPEIAAPWIATLWSGVCALVYTTHHRMPCDSPALPAHDPR